MSVKAYINTGLAPEGTVIPVLLPTDAMRDTARQIGIPECDLFSVNVPIGMTQWTSAKVLIASTQIATLFTQPECTLTLEDSSGLMVRMTGMYARPPQPFFWGQQGGVALVELVDARWWWRFSSAAQLNNAYAFTYSSDGRWQVNSYLTFTELLQDIQLAATADNLYLSMPWGYTAPGTEYVRRIADLFGSPNVNLGLVLDAIAVATQQVIVFTGKVGGGSSCFKFIPRTNLQSQYNAAMSRYRTAMRGGQQPTNGAAGGSDPLVSLWNQEGYEHRAPKSCTVVMPQRSIEGLTVYDNCTVANTPATQQNFTINSIYTAGSNPTWTRTPTDYGSGYVTDAAIVCRDNTGAILIGAPGWNPVGMSAAIRSDYANRYSNIPFGRTVWAGWLPWYLNPDVNIGQIGCVSYRLAMIDGEWSPHTITECREDDWRFGLQGTSWSEPSEVITAKGKAQAYRNCVGATIIDVPPPNTRVFPARITGVEQLATWKWVYSWTEVEPAPSPLTVAPSVSIGAYARVGTLNARNMAENGNVYVAPGNAANMIAPGISQGSYPGATIDAQPISTDTIVEMVEQFPTAYTGGTPPVGPRYWFSMPNAVRVTCTSAS